MKKLTKYVYKKNLTESNEYLTINKTYIYTSPSTRGVREDGFSVVNNP